MIWTWKLIPNRMLNKNGYTSTLVVEYMTLIFAYLLPTVHESRLPRNVYYHRGDVVLHKRRLNVVKHRIRVGSVWSPPRRREMTSLALTRNTRTWRNIWRRNGGAFVWLWTCHRFGVTWGHLHALTHSPTQHNTKQQNATQNNVTQQNTSQHNTTQYNTTQLSTTKHNTSRPMQDDSTF